MRTKIMAAVLLVALIFAWQPAQAKDEPKDDGDKHELITIKYCDSYKDLHYGNWHTADSVWVIIKSNTKKHVNGGVYYKFNSDNKKLEKHLLKKAFAVSYNDTLLINARTYKVTSGYAHGFRMTDGRIVFKCFRGYNPSEAVIAVSAMGGVIGGLVTGAMSESRGQNVLYLISPGQDYTTFVDKKVMVELLDGCPELLTEYNDIKGKDRVNADVILPLLRKAKLLREE